MVFPLQKNLTDTFTTLQTHIRSQIDAREVTDIEERVISSGSPCLPF